MYQLQQQLGDDTDIEQFSSSCRSHSELSLFVYCTSGCCTWDLWAWGAPRTLHVSIASVTVVYDSDYLIKSKDCVY